MSSPGEGCLHSGGNTQVDLHFEERKGLGLDDLKRRDADRPRHDGKGAESVDEFSSHATIILRKSIYIIGSGFGGWVHQVDDQQHLQEHPERVQDLEGLFFQLLVGLRLVDLLRKAAGLRDQPRALHPKAALVRRVRRRRNVVRLAGLIEEDGLFIRLGLLYLFLELGRQQAGGSFELLALLHGADGLFSGKRLVLMRVRSQLRVSLLCHFGQGLSGDGLV